ncbi:hypothetical protein SAMN05444672_105171 [Bacillus sp. OK838]|nr:hypothetical protein SAMN05444672_105171 [Bacillus sp. OK838]
MRLKIVHLLLSFGALLVSFAALLVNFVLLLVNFAALLVSFAALLVSAILYGQHAKSFRHSISILKTGTKPVSFVPVSASHGFFHPTI